MSALMLSQGMTWFAIFSASRATASRRPLLSSPHRTSQCCHSSALAPPGPALPRRPLAAAAMCDSDMQTGGSAGGVPY